MRPAGPRDDRLLPETRWAALVVTAILIPALVILWGLPGRTDDLWAWTIKPEMTAIFMGSGYGAGAYFFARVAAAQRWHPAAAGVLSAALFAALMLVVTLIHWDRFNHGDAPFVGAAVFYGWVGVYIVSPIVVGWLWLRNTRTDPGAAEPGDPTVPAGARRSARVLGAATIGAGTLFLVAPAVAIDVWPWALTPLTARVIACFTIQVGLGAMLLSADVRWSSWRLLLQTFLVATALLLAGAARAWDDFEGASAWLFTGGLAGLAVAVIALYARMVDGRRSKLKTRPHVL